MSCCGQKRQAWQQSNLPKIQAAPPSPPVLQNPVILRHLGTSSLLVNGAVTGLVYLFGGSDTELAVDTRDVSALTATGQFAVVAPTGDSQA